MIQVLVGSKESASQAAANQIAARVEECTECSRRKFVLGTATGSTPEQTYGFLVDLCLEGVTRFDQVHCYGLDEYVGLPIRHPESYAEFMRVHFWDPVGISLEGRNLPSLQGADTYDERIEESGGIDVLLLGIGANGHIGFNEPGSPFNSLTRVVDLKQETRQANSRFFDGDVSAVPEQAVTMGIGTILKAKEIVLLAFGKGKAEAVAAMLEGLVGEHCPATALRNHPSVTVYLDEEAASLLEDTEIRQLTQELAE